MTDKPRRPYWLLGIAALALAVRGAVILSGTEISPDSRYFRLLAHNLVTNGCYSASDPGSRVCEPTWGSQPPGYVLFLGLLEQRGGLTSTTTLVVQSSLFCVALAYALWMLGRLGVGTKVLASAGFVVAVSPSTIGWSRWMLTETLAAAGGLWVFAECLSIVVNRRVPIARVSLALGLCGMMRWDMAWFAIPVVLTAFWTLPPRAAAHRAGVVALLVSVPYLLLLVRAAAVGLPPVPQPAIPEDEVAPGVQSLWRTVAVSQAYTASVVWPVWNRKYSDIQKGLDSTSFIECEPEGRPISRLLGRLSALPDGEPVARSLDSELKAAAVSCKESGVLFRLRVLMSRMVKLWTGADDIYQNGFRWESAVGAFWSAVADIERPLLLAAMLAGFASWRSRTAWVMLAALLILCVTRTLFLTLLTMIEIRYLVPMVPVAELGAVAFWGVPDGPRRSGRSWK